MRTQECAQLRHQHTSGSQSSAAVTPSPHIGDSGSQRSNTSPLVRAAVSPVGSQGASRSTVAPRVDEERAVDTVGTAEPRAATSDVQGQEHRHAAERGAQDAALGVACIRFTPASKPGSVAAVHTPGTTTAIALAEDGSGSRRSPGKEMAEAIGTPLVMTKPRSVVITPGGCYSPVPQLATRRMTPVKASASTAQTLQYCVAASQQGAVAAFERARSSSPGLQHGLSAVVRQGSSPGSLEPRREAVSIATVEPVSASVGQVRRSTSPRTTLEVARPWAMPVALPQQVLVMQPAGVPQGMVVSMSSPALPTAVTPGFNAAYGRAAPPPTFVGRM